jgi:hypothetical protein
MQINMGLHANDLMMLHRRAPCARKQDGQLIPDARNRDPRRPLVPISSKTAAIEPPFSFELGALLMSESPLSTRSGRSTSSMRAMRDGSVVMNGPPRRDS